MLLASHRRLLTRHRIRMVRLTRVAKRLGTGLPCFVVVELGSAFAEVCSDAGIEFLDVDPDDEGKGAWVVPMCSAGLLAILGAVFPAGVEPVLTRPAGTIGILAVDADDHPAIAILGIEQLTLEPGRA